MGLGTMDRKITIEHKVTGRDSSGEVVGEFVPWAAPIWAEELPGGGKEGKAGGAETQTHTATFRIRYRPGITPKMRISCRGRAYDIEDVTEPRGERRRYLLIRAVGREIKSGG